MVSALMSYHHLSSHFAGLISGLTLYFLRIFQHDVERAQSIYSQIMNTDSRLCQNLKVSLTAFVMLAVRLTHANCSSSKFHVDLQVLQLAMAGSTKDAASVLRAAVLSESLVFVKKPDFCQDVVRLI